MGHARTRASRTSMLLLGLVVAGVAACSSSGGSSSSGTTTGSGAGSGSSSGAASSTPFDVVIDTGVTGPYGANGTAAVDGLKAAADVLNATQGGILGHKVKVEVLDNQGNPSTAATLLEQRLSSGPKPDMIEPGSISTEGVVEVPIANSAKILSIGTPNDQSLDNPSKYPYEFFMSPSTMLPQQALMDYFKAHHYTTVGMIYSTDAYGASTGQATIAAAKQAGITLDTVTYEDTVLNMTSELQKLQAGHPQALYVQGFGAPPGIILQNLYALGWKIPVIGDQTTAATPVIAQDAGKPYEKGLQLQTLALNQYSANESTAVKNYISALEKYGPIDSPLVTTSFQYDSLMVVAQAAKQANSIATPDIVKALENLKQPSDPLWVTLSQYQYSASNHAPTAPPSNWVVVPASPLTNGQFGAPSSSS
jgi:branched-chain amino acid transport system substrate-binding protein